MALIFFFKECLKPKLISLSCWWRSSRMFERFLQHLSLYWRNGHCCSRGDSAWEISSEGSACVLLSEAEGHWTAGVTPALSCGAWGELSVWNPLKKNENSTKIRQNYTNRKRQLIFPYEWFCRQENLRQKCCKRLPWFIKDGSSSPWLVQMRSSVPGVLSRGSSAGPWVGFLVSWSCAGSSSGSPGKPSSVVLCLRPGLSAQGAGSPHWNTSMFHYFAKDNPARTMSNIFQVYTLSRNSKPRCSPRFPWDFFSSFSAWGIKPVIWNLHPYYLLPSPSICTISKSPGQRCHYAQSLPSQVHSGDLTMLIKRADEEQKINKPAIVPVRIAATRKLKNYTWHMLPGCTQHCCSTPKTLLAGTKKTKICKKKPHPNLQNLVMLQKCLFFSLHLWDCIFIFMA